MSTKTTAIRVSLLMILSLMIVVVPAMAGSAVVGSVAGSTNATVGGQSLLPNTTIFSGDSLQVRDGVAVVAIGKSGRMVFGRDTSASFLRDASAVTVLLSQGNVSVFHPGDGTVVRVKAGSVSVAPTAGFKSLGEVAMLNGAVVVTAKEGSLLVDDHGASKTVAKGQTIVIAPKTADKKSGGGGWGGGSEGLEIAAVGAGATAAVLAGLSIKHANDVTNAANAATTAANAATSAANTANATAASALAAATSANTNAAGALQVATCTYDYITLHQTNSPILPSSPCPAIPAGP